MDLDEEGASLTVFMRDDLGLTLEEAEDELEAYPNNALIRTFAEYFIIRGLSPAEALQVIEGWLDELKRLRGPPNYVDGS